MKKKSWQECFSQVPRLSWRENSSVQYDTPLNTIHRLKQFLDLIQIRYEASGELGALSRETGRIMQLPLTAGGTMQLKAGSSPSDTGYQDELDLELQKFSC